MVSRVLAAGLLGTALLSSPSAAAPLAGDDGSGAPGDGTIVQPGQPVHVLLELEGVPASNALAFVQNLPLGSFDLDLNYPPVPVVEEDPSKTGFEGSDDNAASTGVMPIGVPPVPPSPPPGGTAFVPKTTHIVRGTIDPADIPLVLAQPEIVAVWDDAPVRHMGPWAPPPPGGGAPAHACVPWPTGTPPSLDQVREALAAQDLGRYGGAGVVIGIVDGGIDAGVLLSQIDPQLGITQDPVIGGWPADYGTKADKWFFHGNMTAFDALAMAPQAKLYDLRISDNTSPFLDPDRGLISDAIAAYDWALREHAMTGKPDILSNSWGIFDKDNAPNYATDRNHPFTRKAVEAVDHGMIVLFAAGNCGGDPTFPYQSACGSYVGHGQDIWGANGHPRVITVGAATADRELLCFSSRGPAALHPLKPDFLSVSHFLGFYAGFSQSTFADSGTSAACAVTAGLVADLLEATPGASLEDVRLALRAKAFEIGTPHSVLLARYPAFSVSAKWNPDSGAGVIRARDAMEYLNASGPAGQIGTVGQQVVQ